MANWLTILLSGGVAVAFVSGLFKLLDTQVTNRSIENSAKLKAAEALIAQNKDNVSALIAAGRVIIRISIKETVQKCIEKGEVSYDEREDVIQMYEIYRDNLAGNGNLTTIMDLFLNLQTTGYKKGEGQ